MVDNAGSRYGQDCSIDKLLASLAPVPLGEIPCILRIASTAIISESLATMDTPSDLVELIAR